MYLPLLTWCKSGAERERERERERFDDIEDIKIHSDNTT